MDLKQALQEQAEICFRDMAAVLNDLSDAQLTYTDPRLDERSIAGVAMHGASAVSRLCGIVTTGGGSGRPAGGPPPPPTSTSALLTELEEIKQGVLVQLGVVSDERLAAELTMPWGERTNGVAGVMFGFTHAIRHVGTILDLRALGGFPTHVLG